MGEEAFGFGDDDGPAVCCGAAGDLEVGICVSGDGLKGAGGLSGGDEVLLDDGIVNSAEEGEATEGIGDGFEIALKSHPDFGPGDVGWCGEGVGESSCVLVAVDGVLRGGCGGRCDEGGTG